MAKKITKRQIARAAKKIWGRCPEERREGRGTIRAVLSALRITHD